MILIIESAVAWKYAAAPTSTPSATKNQMITNHMIIVFNWLVGIPAYVGPLGMSAASEPRAEDAATKAPIAFAATLTHGGLGRAFAFGLGSGVLEESELLHDSSSSSR